jgi:fucose permease
MDAAIASQAESRPHPWRRGPLLAAACASMLVFGSVMALLGALLPELAPRLGFGLAQSGRLFLVMNAAMLAASLAAGSAIDRAGFRLPLALGSLLVAAAMALVAAASSYGHLIPAMLLLGLGGGALNAASNTLTADLHAEERRKNAALNLLGVFFGFGALLVPLLVGALVNTAGVRPLLAGASAVCLTLAAACALLRYPQPKAAGQAPAAGFAKLLTNPLVLVLGLLLMLQSGNEFLLGGFISTFLVSAAGMSVAAASFSLTSFWAAILIARLLWGRLLLAVDGRTLICACAGASAAAGILLAAATSQGVAVAAVPLLGFAASGIFPTALGLAGARFADQSGSVIGLLLAMALVGGMTVPWLAGQAGEAWGVRATMAFAPAAFLLILVLAIAAGRKAKDGP